MSTVKDAFDTFWRTYSDERVFGRQLKRDEIDEQRQTWLDEVDQNDDVDPVDAEADEIDNFNEE